MASSQEVENCAQLRESLIAALTRLREGDFTVRLALDTTDPRDEEIAVLFNQVVGLNETITDEFNRVAKVVGKEGEITQRANVKGAAGGWQMKLNAVNELVDDMVQPITEVARVIGAVAEGDLSQRMSVEIDGRGLKGEFLRIGKVVNTMVDQLGSFASEVTRVAREVGTEGKLGGQARVKGVAGTWRDLTENVNLMAENLTGQVRNIAEVTTAVARGDLSKKITVDVKGEILELKVTVNTMVDQLNAFASEVTRVAREVGTEGKLGGQAEVPGVAGTWADLTDNVNLMAANLTGQVRNIAEVTTAVARGDLSKKITVEVRGEIAELKNTINTMVDQLNSFASEVTRVAREVGTEGRLGGQARVEGVGGTWKDLTDNVNELAANLTGQVRNIAEVTTAVALGDLSKKITVDVKGEIAELKNTINTMVDQLNSFASEVTRVAREVGSEGKLGGQAEVPGVAGTWANLTNNVNELAANLTGQVRNIAEVTTAVARGDLSKKITVDVKGEILELKGTINTMVDQLNSFASEVTRVAREVGTEGKLGGQATVPGVGGTWKDLTENVNLMADNLTGQVRNIAEVTTAVARGDLSKKITVDVKGEILELKNTVNVMVDQLNSFASEVTRVAREVGTEGKLGGQAEVPGVGGTWKDLTDNVNLMATNLTNQVRGIADVVTAVAQGDLKRKLTVDAKGEIAALAETINGMIETLSTFGDQVTNMAREVGVEGRLGGQARVPGAAGLWRDLTDNVNQLAANLTNQVRSIAEVATAVTKGDLTRSISVEASGEMASLKDTINEMIVNLKDQTLKNAEQDWLKTNLARFSRMLQGERDLATISNLIMSELAPLVNAQYGVFYVANDTDGPSGSLDLVASYGAGHADEMKSRFSFREGLIGQAAADKRPMRLDNVPGDYIRIGSGLVEGRPAHVNILPALFEDEVKAVIELASFEEFNETHHSFLTQLMETVGIVLNTIAATMRTEELLKESQLLTQELQTRQSELTIKQEELHNTNEELQEKAQLLENEKKQVEAKNFEIEMARRAVEEKAEQLALTSKYKSEFLANMSHELRTPLNSLLILSKLLADNQGGNLNEKQTEFARTIHGAGSDLLNLINDILDLSKIESGTVSIELGDMPLAALQQHMERTFRQLASEKGLDFEVHFSPELPGSIHTDEKRLQQVVLNLLSNAFKFTAHGKVELDVRIAASGWNTTHPVLRDVTEALAISVSDTGIGIPSDKQRLIFEAFQQADGTTSRKYGGTGLGLSISREIAGLLGGELQVQSRSGEGSTFTLFLPLRAASAPALSHPVAGIAPAPLPVAEPTDDRSNLGKDAVVLIVEDDPAFASILLDMVHEEGLKGVISPTGSGATALARKIKPAAITLDLGLSDMDGFVLLDLLRGDSETAAIPIYVISGGDRAEDARSLGATDVIEKPVERERLTELFRGVAQRKPRKQGSAKARKKVAFPANELAGKKILIVDDDIRNIYSLTSVLEARGAAVMHAERGQEAIDLLESHPDINAALIDIMMPEMDGYETIKRIRSKPRIADIPLVAVTAKAMVGDRQKCLEAGADDYVAKPVDVDVLMALLRVTFERAALKQPNGRRTKRVAA
ncbi:signal transduction histidine kinase [Novosphingobium kunmingense]|uniref:histidine kinase n=1 Tax=Novosphingobium kunmingense TaxID=1211806 RepID=A0A2N0H3J9_9SPHN|nr:HAMP domain-containing protein [Novosphingobium kunmingense]PKB13499.1 signal transduction histidine kinase [Novosphingobium kunmingense]